MAGFMRSHYQIEPHIFIVGRIPPEQRGKGNGSSIGTDRCASRHRRHRIRKRLNLHIRSAQPLHEQFDGPGDLPQRHTAQSLLHRCQGPLRFQPEVRSRSLYTVGQDFHPRLEPIFKSRHSIGGNSDHGDDLRAAPQIRECRRRIPFSD